MQKNSNEALSVKEVESNLPTEIIRELQRRFYHARLEFGKMKKHQKRLKAKRGKSCAWGKKLSEDGWVRKIRSHWSQGDSESKKTSGRNGYGFVTLFKIWLYAAFFGVEQNAEEIYNALGKNPLYAQLCGLKKIGKGEDDAFDVPAARTIRYFNQIMYTFDLWGDLARWLLLYNLEQEAFEWTDELAIDPTHLDAFASVGKLCHECKTCPKKENCQFKQTTCEMTGIVSKSKNFRLPGVKLNFALLPGTEIVVAAIACRGQVHDSQLLKPLLEKLAQDYPELQERVKKILADAAYDDEDCHEQAQQIAHAQLETSINPRARKPIPSPARGIAEISPYGVPICDAGHEMELSGRDIKREQFIWVCPVFHPQHGDENLSCSEACHQRCSPDSINGRVLRVSRNLTPQINWENPQQMASVSKRYCKRTSVERAISRFKRILKFERFFNRGTKALQAHGDRYVVAILLVAFVAHLLGRPELTRKYRLTTLPPRPIPKPKNLSKSISRNSRLSYRSSGLSRAST